MKYFLVFFVILLLGCSMPGVGELEERVDDIEAAAVYDDSDMIDRIDEVEGDVEVLDERVTAIEYGDFSGAADDQGRRVHETGAVGMQVQKDLAISDIAGLQDSMDIMKTDLSDSITVLDESLANLVLSVDSLTMENDSLKIELEDLQDQIQSLSYTVENMRYTGTASTSTRGSTSGTGGSGGRGGSTGGGTSGGGTR
jgi:chromosome segregation ATPase